MFVSNPFCLVVLYSVINMPNNSVTVQFFNAVKLWEAIITHVINSSFCVSVINIKVI